MFSKKKKVEYIEQPRLVETMEDVELRYYGELLTKEDFIYTLNKDEQTCTIHKLLKTYPKLMIPETVEGHTVTVLENKDTEAIFDDDTVKEVVIPDSVKIIGKHCFNECKSVEVFHIGSGVELFDVASFSYCEGIVDFIVPPNVKMIEDYAFRNCRHLMRLTICGKDTEISQDPYVITNIKDQYEGTIYAPLQSKAEEYAEEFEKPFEEWKYVKMEATYNALRPTTENQHICSKKDLDVRATWSNTVVDKIEDYNLDLIEGDNTITLRIQFLEFQQDIVLSTLPKKMIKLDVQYFGEQPRKIKTPLTNEEFRVVASYDDFSIVSAKDFIILNPKLAKGPNAVQIMYDNEVENIKVDGKGGFLFF